MEDNMAEISEDKIKSIDYLFNRIISERVRDSMEPKYSLLMGAGCSVSSQIVSAKDIINMLKTIVYLRELPTEDTQTPFLDLEYGKLVPFLKRWYEKIRIMRSLQNLWNKRNSKYEMIFIKNRYHAKLL